MTPISSLRAWLHRRTAVSELSRLNSRQLADLGIARSQIRAVARNAH